MNFFFLTKNSPCSHFSLESVHYVTNNVQWALYYESQIHIISYVLNSQICFTNFNLWLIPPLKKL